MISLSATVDVRTPIAGLDKLQRRQLPFATALALTRTAQAAQSEIREDLPKHFKQRGSGLSWISRGIGVEAAKKDHSEATVYSRDWFMLYQEEGGTKRPLTAAMLAIPHGKLVGMAERPKPSGLLGQPGVFVNKFASGVEFIGQCTGPGRYPLAILYVLKPTVNVRPEWGFEATVERVANERFPGEMRSALEIALRSAA